MIPSLEGWPTKAKEAPSPHEVRLAPLDTNPVFQSLGVRYFDCDTITRRVANQGERDTFSQWGKTGLAGHQLIIFGGTPSMMFPFNSCPQNLPFSEH